ncbi:hypothetical protein CASFOL_025999 [Castilleja foliolosa]|uniref:Glycosyl transferase family 1 domain-containing protein n=1 Tax=Castilleja foliolosa TaxID=1961234 RepID=A0ABD3CSQ2_9LAMI
MDVVNFTKNVSRPVLPVNDSNNKLTKKKSKKSARNSSKIGRSKPKPLIEDVEIEVEEIPKQNTTYGFLVGPFGSVEDTILEWSPERRSGTCDRKGAFARLVWSRKFVLIFHELSMTGAPLAMMELATEFLSCGATISVIVLNRKGGLMPEHTRRKIKVLEDKTDLSFKTAMKEDLIIAGSAVCSSWIARLMIESGLIKGLGETFGRVTIEAMAFGLPVLGTDSGGTKEIVEHGVTGLLHPLGRPGARNLAKNLELLLQNASARVEMGIRGREKVEKMYMKKLMFQKFGEVLYKCMRIK